MKIKVLLLTFLSLFLVSNNNNATTTYANDNKIYEEAYSLNFESNDLSMFEFTNSNASIVNDLVFNNALSMDLSSNESLIKNKAFTCNNDTIYTFIFKYHHESTNGAYHFEITSDQFNYGVRFDFNNDKIIKASKDNDISAIDRKSYEIANQGKYNILKCTIWSGFENDWRFKFSGNNVTQNLIIDDFNIYKGVAIETNKYFSNAKKIMYEDGENGTLIGGDFTASNYKDMEKKDGRITNKAKEVISGNYSIAATFKNVKGWQPFISSSVLLKENEVYTVSFDYKNIYGNGRLSINCYYDGPYYRVMYLDKNGNYSVEAGQYDKDIGTNKDNWHDNYYGEHNLFSYVIKQNDYYSVKFTFICPKEGATINFCRVDNDGVNDDTRYSIDNIRVLKGTSDATLFINDEKEEINYEVIEEEKFEEKSNRYQLNSNAILTVSKDDAIADNGSLHVSSNTSWNDFVRYNFQVLPNNEYTITFKYRFDKPTLGSYAFINIKSNSNVDDASYLGITENGAYNNFKNNVSNAIFKEYYDYMQATITLKTKNSNDYVFVIGGYGNIDMLLDDLVIVKGNYSKYINDSVINSSSVLILKESFDDGYGYFNRCEKNDILNGIITNKENEVINGTNSLYGSGTNYTKIAATKNNLFTANTQYTLLFRARISKDANLYVSFNNNEYNNANSTICLNSKGQVKKEYSLGLISYETNVKNNYLDIRLNINSTNSNTNYLMFAIENGNVAIDDVIIYKGKKNINYETDAKYLKGGKDFNKLAYEDEKFEYKFLANITNLEGINNFSLVLDDYYVLTDKCNINDSIVLTCDNKNININAILDTVNKKINITIIDSLILGKEYVLTIKNLTNGCNIINDYNLTLPCGDAKKLFINLVNECKILKDKAEIEKKIEEALAMYENVKDKNSVQSAYDELNKIIENLKKDDSNNQPNKGCKGNTTPSFICLLILALFIKRKSFNN